MPATVLAVRLIPRVDAELRERLREGGLRTAQGRDWETLRAEIVETYRGAAGMAVDE